MESLLKSSVFGLYFLSHKATISNTSKDRKLSQNRNTVDKNKVNILYAII